MGKVDVDLKVVWEFSAETSFDNAPIGMARSDTDNRYFRVIPPFARSSARRCEPSRGP